MAAKDLPAKHMLSRQICLATSVTVVINFVIGLAFLFGPEIGQTLWPNPVPPLLMRFIGSIILANGLGAWLIVKNPTWESARTLFAVALAYGAIILPFLMYHLWIKDAPTIFWLYVMADLIFLIPIIVIYRKYERN
jgi:hypothetical protein